MLPSKYNAAVIERLAESLHAMKLDDAILAEMREFLLAVLLVYLANGSILARYLTQPPLQHALQILTTTNFSSHIPEEWINFETAQIYYVLQDKQRSADLLSRITKQSPQSPRVKRKEPSFKRDVADSVSSDVGTVSWRPVLGDLKERAQVLLRRGL
jgi:hypothetical protein